MYKSCLHLPSTQHSFDPQPDLSLGAGKTRENTERGCASNRNTPKTGSSGSLIPAVHTDTALPTPALCQGAHESFLPSQEGSFLGSIPWICPSGRVIPKFNPPGTTLTCSRGSSAQLCPASLTGSLDNYRENQGKSQF